MQFYFSFIINHSFMLGGMCAAFRPRADQEQYARDLEEQLLRGVEVLGETHRQQTDRPRRAQGAAGSPGES